MQEDSHDKDLYIQLTFPFPPFLSHIVTLIDSPFPDVPTSQEKSHFYRMLATHHDESNVNANSNNISTILHLYSCKAKAKPKPIASADSVRIRIRIRRIIGRRRRKMTAITSQCCS